jgi:hypothetical protein
MIVGYALDEVITAGLSGTPSSREMAFVILSLQLRAFDHRTVGPDRPANLVRLQKEFGCHVDRQVA